MKRFVTTGALFLLLSVQAVTATTERQSAAIRVTARSGLVPAADHLFRKCEIVDGRVSIVYTAAGRKIKPIAIKACLAKLGF